MHLFSSFRIVLHTNLSTLLFWLAQAGQRQRYSQLCCAVQCAHVAATASNMTCAHACVASIYRTLAHFTHITVKAQASL